MSTITVEMSAKELQLWRAQQKIIDQQARMQQGYRNVGQSAQTMGQQAGKAGQGAARIRQELNRVEKAGKSAFGPRALSDLKSYALGFVGVGTAIATALGILRELDQERAELAERQRQARMGMSELAQLAETPGEMTALTRRARAIFAAGGAENLDEAARLVFALESAGAGRFEELFSQLKAKGLVAEPDVMARAAKTMIATMGEAETGTFRDLVSKAFGASKFSPSRAEELLEAAAKSGVYGRAMRMPDEEIMAAMAIVATAKGGAEMGGTYMAQMFRTLQEKAEFEGMPLEEIMGILGTRKEAMAPEEWKKWWGRAQGREAAEILLANMEDYQKALQEVTAAQAEDRVGRKLALPGVDPMLRASMERERQENLLELAREEEGRWRNLGEAAWASWERKVREKPISGFEKGLGLWITKQALGIEEWFRGEETVARRLAEQLKDYDPAVQQTIEDVDEARHRRGAEVFRQFIPVATQLPFTPPSPIEAIINAAVKPEPGLPREAAPRSAEFDAVIRNLEQAAEAQRRSAEELKQAAGDQRRAAEAQEDAADKQDRAAGKMMAVKTLGSPTRDN